VTISLVSYEGSRWLPGCVAAIEAQTLTDYEVLAHDNGSADGSLSALRAYASRDARVRVTASDRNEGYVAPHDRAIVAARGEVVVLLNQDVELDPGFLAAVVDAFERHPEAASVQARVLTLAAGGVRVPVVDTTGLLMGRDHRAVSRHRGEPDGPALGSPGPVWGADGPAPAHRRRALLEARVPATLGGWEVLDRDFVTYKEDVDLAWRLHLLGWVAWYEPAAVAWHARGTGDSGARGPRATALANRAIPSSARALSWRNQRLMQIKNESLGGYARDLPFIVIRETLTLGFLIVVDPGALRAVVDLVRTASSALRKRRYLQALIASRTTGPPRRWPSPRVG
jgi:GT2 family glycosyltransferase